MSFNQEEIDEILAKYSSYKPNSDNKKTEDIKLKDKKSEDKKLEDKKSEDKKPDERLFEKNNGGYT